MSTVPPTEPPTAAPAGAAAKSPILSIIALVAGILGLLGACCWGVGFLPAVAGIVLGVLGRKREPNGKGLALAGLITGIAGVVISVIVWILFAVLLATGNSLPGWIPNTYGY